MITPIIAFLNATPDRSPMTDWYQTKTARKVGFTARPVVGGVFLQMLYDLPLWQKYAGRDRTKAANWAPMPKAPKVTVIVPAADQQAAIWDYTTSRPASDWMTVQFQLEEGAQRVWHQRNTRRRRRHHLAHGRHLVAAGD